MPAIDFPNSPTVGQQFTSGNRTWEWTGTVWATVAFPLGATSPVTYTDGEFGFDSLAYAQQENFELLYVKNTTGSAITKGSAVYVSGSTGDNVLITKAQANSELTSTKTVGLVYADIANDGFGYVVTSGKITGINTSTAAAGDPVWLSPTTAGGITFGIANKPVAPNHMVYLGIVVRAHATVGEIEVAVQNGYELDELHNVLIESPADNEVIAWDNATSIWKNQTAAEAGLAAASHAHAISDVTGLQTALDGKAGLSSTVINVNTDSSYTLTSADNGKFIALYPGESDVTLTVPDVLPVGGRVDIINRGTANVTVVGSGLTIRSKDSKFRLDGRYAGASIIRDNFYYYLVGSLKI